MRAWEIHPALVQFLIGGVMLDLFGQSSETAVAVATYLLIAGLATGAIAAVAGVVAYYTPAIHKPGLRSMAEANNSLPAGTTGPVMTEHYGKPAGAEKTRAQGRHAG
jgi:hypothetical protein